MSIEISYGAYEACDIVGISYRQLDHWCKEHGLRVLEGDTAPYERRRFSHWDLRRLTQIRDLVHLGNLPIALAVTATIDDPTYAVIVRTHIGNEATPFWDSAEAINECIRLRSDGFSSSMLTFVDPLKGSPV